MSALGDLLDVMSLHQAADPGADAEPAIGQVHRTDVDADPRAAFGIVPKRVELTAEFRRWSRIQVARTTTTIVAKGSVSETNSPRASRIPAGRRG